VDVLWQETFNHTPCRFYHFAVSRLSIENPWFKGTPGILLKEWFHTQFSFIDTILAIIIIGGFVRRYPRLLRKVKK
jgi:hypothetical protein